jgi:hypothetical protein
VLYHAEEIGISLGTGLSRVRHRVNDFVDEKSRPKDNMSNWWISSNWTNPESADGTTTRISLASMRPVVFIIHNKYDI